MLRIPGFPCHGLNSVLSRRTEISQATHTIKEKKINVQNLYGENDKVKVKSLSRVLLFETPWTVVYQAPPSMGFSRQEYWSGLPFPSPGDLPNPGIEPESPTL